MQPLNLNFVTRIVLTYLIFAALWIVFSDRALEAIASNEDQISTLQTVKGLLFIVITGVIIYYLLNREFKRREVVEDQLRRLNTNLEARVSAATSELQEANDRLTALNDAQSKIIRDVSHALRTPLTTINMRLDLINRVEETRIPEYLPGVRTQVEILNDMVENLLDLSRIEADSDEGFTSLNINSVVERAIEAHIGFAQDRGLKLDFRPEDDLPSIDGHAQELVMMTSNIVQNSLKYTGKGGVTIETSYKDDTEEIILRIQDTGIGIDSEEFKHVFERFYRTHSAIQSGVPGTGLGLVIVKEIVDRHRGWIKLDSELSKGTTFTIGLPLVQPVNQQQTALGA